MKRRELVPQLFNFIFGGVFLAFDLLERVENFIHVLHDLLQFSANLFHLLHGPTDAADGQLLAVHWFARPRLLRTIAPVSAITPVSTIAAIEPPATTSASTIRAAAVVIWP